jgi:hypothetical protein
LRNPPRTSRRRTGQAFTESLLLMPLYLLLIFGLLQLAQLGVAVLVTNYAAGTIARQLVQDGTTDASVGMPRFQKLMVAGMSVYGLQAETEGSGLLTDVTVHACTKVGAMPVVNYFVKHALPKNPLPQPGACLDEYGLFRYYRQWPYYFVVHGKATARMNYRPQ